VLWVYQHHRHPAESVLIPECRDGSHDLAFGFCYTAAIWTQPQKEMPVIFQLVPAARAAQSQTAFDILLPHLASKYRHGSSAALIMSTHGIWATSF
jgi:hypothetical protein